MRTLHGCTTFLDLGFLPLSKNPCLPVDSIRTDCGCRGLEPLLVQPHMPLIPRGPVHLITEPHARAARRRRAGGSLPICHTRSVTRRVWTDPHLHARAHANTAGPAFPQSARCIVDHACFLTRIDAVGTLLRGFTTCFTTFLDPGASLDCLCVDLCTCRCGCQDEDMPVEVCPYATHRSVTS